MNNQSARGNRPGGIGGVFARTALGWAVFLAGILVTVGTLVISAFVILSAETTGQFAALLVSAFFFAAFPFLTGLGLVIWGRKLVLRSGRERPLP